MGIGKFLRKQFIDVIQWPNPEEGMLVWRFPMDDEEIQNGASLTVRESQMALFVDEGVLADTISPGIYKLNTNTLPVLTYLKNWDKFFESPFKSDVYFFNTKLQLGCKWGTSQPITVRDKEFGMVSLRAFGMYSYKISDPAKFFKEVSGIRSEYYGKDMEGQLRNLVVTSLSNLFGSSNIPFIDMAANQVALSEQMTQAMIPAFERYGLTLDTFAVESITLPDALQKTLDERISMGIVGDMGRYTQYQTATSIPLAAQNEGGLAGLGASMAAGANMGQAMAGAMMGAQMGQSGVTAPPQETPEAKLLRLKDMLDKGLINQDDYEKSKAEILKQMVG